LGGIAGIVDPDIKPLVLGLIVDFDVQAKQVVGAVRVLKADPFLGDFPINILIKMHVVRHTKWHDYLGRDLWREVHLRVCTGNPGLRG